MTTDDLAKYPSSDLDSGRNFLANLGSFWTLAFSDSAESISTATLELNSQTLLDYLETVASVSRFNTPVFHKQLWNYVTIRKSEVNSSLVTPLTYGDNQAKYGQAGTSPYDRIFNYGDSVSVYNYRFSIPRNIRGVSQILDAAILPKTILQSGIDYSINSDAAYVEFYEDPFTSGKFTARSIINPTTGLADSEIDLWFFNASVDLNIIYEQFGYALEMFFAKSSANYKDLLNAVWDAAILGPTSDNFRRAIAAIMDVPTVRNPVEVVKKIVTTDPRHIQIITDLEVYTYNKNSVVNVFEGATVSVGDFLVDTVQIGEDSSSTLQLLNKTSANITIGPELSTLSLSGPLVFHHGAYPTSYSLVGDKAVVSFTGIDGASTDLTTFWNNANTVGQNTGYSVARALRNNPERTDEPGSWEIPATVSPAMFLVDKVFGTNLTILHLDFTLAGPNNLGKDALKYLRKILPAHKTVLTNIIE
jgi:hypothetical protein